MCCFPLSRPPGYHARGAVARTRASAFAQVRGHEWGCKADVGSGLDRHGVRRMLRAHGCAAATLGGPGTACRAWTRRSRPSAILAPRDEPRRLAPCAAAALAGTVGLASGCAGRSRRSRPTTTYEPADGVPVDLERLDLRNLVVVGRRQGRHRHRLGQVVNKRRRAPSTSPSPSRAAASRHRRRCRPAPARRLSDSPRRGVEIPGDPGGVGAIVQMQSPPTRRAPTSSRSRCCRRRATTRPHARRSVRERRRPALAAQAPR